MQQTKQIDFHLASLFTEAGGAVIGGKIGLDDEVTFGDIDGKACEVEE